jgi:hypothetical protein
MNHLDEVMTRIGSLFQMQTLPSPRLGSVIVYQSTSRYYTMLDCCLHAKSFIDQSQARRDSLPFGTRQFLAFPMAELRFYGVLLRT